MPAAIVTAGTIASVSETMAYYKNNYENIMRMYKYPQKICLLFTCTSPQVVT